MIQAKVQSANISHVLMDKNKPTKIGIVFRRAPNKTYWYEMNDSELVKDAFNIIHTGVWAGEEMSSGKFFNAVIKNFCEYEIEESQ